MFSIQLRNLLADTDLAVEHAAASLFEKEGLFRGWQPRYKEVITAYEKVSSKINVFDKASAKFLAKMSEAGFSGISISNPAGYLALLLELEPLRLDIEYLETELLTELSPLATSYLDFLDRVVISGLSREYNTESYGPSKISAVFTDPLNGASAGASWWDWYPVDYQWRLLLAAVPKSLLGENGVSARDAFREVFFGGVAKSFPDV